MGLFSDIGDQAEKTPGEMEKLKEQSKKKGNPFGVGRLAMAAVEEEAKLAEKHAEKPEPDNTTGAPFGPAKPQTELDKLK